MTIYFENLIIALQVLYIFKKHVKFHVNQMLFNTRSINLFFYVHFRLQKLKFKYLVDEIAIDFLSY